MSDNTPEKAKLKISLFKNTDFGKNTNEKYLQAKRSFRIFDQTNHE